MVDLERIGLFKEMGYTSINDPFRTVLINHFTGKNFIVPGSKIPCGNTDGYFNDFQRVFDGEKGITNFIDIRRKWRLESRLRNLGKDWIPSSNSIKLCGLGSHAGLFHPHIPAFGTATKSLPYIPVKKNILTNPGPKGSGYGYSNVCINKYPEYIMGNKYNDFEGIYKKLNDYHELKVGGRPVFVPPSAFCDYFTVNPFLGGSNLTRPEKPGQPVDKPFIVASYPKKDGGMKAGTINPFPPHMPCPYTDKPFFVVKEVLNDQGKKFLPNNNFPTYFPTASVLKKNVIFHCNNTNIGNVSSVY